MCVCVLGYEANVFLIVNLGQKEVYKTVLLNKTVTPVKKSPLGHVQNHNSGVRITFLQIPWVSNDLN